MAKSTTKGFQMVCERPLKQLLDILSSGGHLSLPQYVCAMLVPVSFGYRSAQKKDLACCKGPCAPQLHGMEDQLLACFANAAAGLVLKRAAVPPQSTSHH